MVLNNLSKSTLKAGKNLTNFSLNAAGQVERVVRRTETEFNTYVAPVRETVLKRYPTLFAFLVTVGVLSTFLGFEQILLRIEFLQEKPWLIFLIGISILFFTGKLYKKLGQI